MAIQIIHKKSSVITDRKPKLPTSSQLEYGELAINYAKDNETISLKNNENEIVEFKSTKYLEKIITENEEITAASLTDLDERVSAVDGKISENNEAISASLNDLNERIIILDADLSNKSDENHTHEGVYATYNDLSDYATQNDLSTLRNDFNTLVSGDTKNTIESFKEVTAFLSGVTDTQSLDGILAGLATKESVNNLVSEIETNEEITAASLTILNEKVSAVDGKISDNNEAISASLNDLNEKITILNANLSNKPSYDDLNNYTTSDELSDYTAYNDFTGHTNDNSIHLTIGTSATNAAAGNHKHTSEDITDSVSLSVQISPNTTELVQGKAVLELVNTKISASTNQLQGQIDTITEDYAKKTDIPTSATVESWGFAKKSELTGYTTDAEFNTLSNTVNGKQDKISDLDTIRNNANLGASALQSVPSEYITETELNSKGYATQSNLNTLTDRVTTVENYTVPDARNNVLWIGTSIPAGDIQHGNNGTTQSTTTNLGSNNYPKMIADALGFNLYNNARGSSFVCFYPSSEDGTNAWAGKDWSEYSSEVWKGYSLSASFAQVDEKFGPNGLNCPQWLINNFKSYSYESLIIPYIDGTLASCDTVVIDHGYNDRSVILNEASWHPGEGETQFKVGAGREWLLKLQDPFEKTLEAETYFQGKWWNDESVSSKKHYMSAIIFLAKKIWAVNPKIKIIIGNYFASKSNTFGAEFGNDRLAEFVNLSNSACAAWLRVNCVDVWKHTGIYNRNLPAGNDFQLFCPDGVHPHSDSTGHSNKIIAGVYINSIQGTLYI